MHSSKIKRQAEDLRKNGASIKEIAQMLSVSSSTIHYWVGGIKISEVAQQRLENKQAIGRQKGADSRKRQKINFLEKIQKAVKVTLEDLDLSSIYLTKLLCAFLYWGEGGKTERCVSFTNSNNEMVFVFMDLFRKSFKLDESKFRALVHVHDYHNETEIIAYWSKVSKIPVKLFSKSYQKQQGGTNKRAEYKGTLRIRYYDAKIADELRAYYQMYAEVIKNRAVVQR
jgi:predicted transcriptional regulator